MNFDVMPNGPSDGAIFNNAYLAKETFTNENFIIKKVRLYIHLPSYQQNHYR